MGRSEEPPAKASEAGGVRDGDEVVVVHRQTRQQAQQMREDTKARKQRFANRGDRAAKQEAAEAEQAQLARKQAEESRWKLLMQRREQIIRERRTKRSDQSAAPFGEKRAESYMYAEAISEQLQREREQRKGRGPIQPRQPRQVPPPAAVASSWAPTSQPPPTAAAAGGSNGASEAAARSCSPPRPAPTHGGAAAATPVTSQKAEVPAARAAEIVEKLRRLSSSPQAASAQPAAPAASPVTSPEAPRARLAEIVERLRKHSPQPATAQPAEAAAPPVASPGAQAPAARAAEIVERLRKHSPQPSVHLSPEAPVRAAAIVEALRRASSSSALGSSAALELGNAVEAERSFTLLLREIERLRAFQAGARAEAAAAAAPDAVGVPIVGVVRGVPKVVSNDSIGAEAPSPACQPAHAPPSPPGNGRNVTHGANARPLTLCSSLCRCLRPGPGGGELR